MHKWYNVSAMRGSIPRFYFNGDRYFKTRNVTSADVGGWNFEQCEITKEEYQELLDEQTRLDESIIKILNAQSEYSEGYNAAVTLMDVEAPTVASAEVMRPMLMKAVASLDDADAAVVPSFFPEWDGAGHEYKTGDRVRYTGGTSSGEGTLYKCLQDHTSQATWDPPDAPSLWARTDDPAVEWPEWVQPTGSTDAYAVGAKVSHNGKHWISNTPNNTWEPGVYGWDEVPE